MIENLGIPKTDCYLIIFLQEEGQDKQDTLDTHDEKRKIIDRDRLKQFYIFYQAYQAYLAHQVFLSSQSCALLGNLVKINDIFLGCRASLHPVHHA